MGAAATAASVTVVSGHPLPPVTAVLLSLPTSVVREPRSFPGLSHARVKLIWMTGTTDEGAGRRRLLRQALRVPRGRYPAERASHLSGVPRSTVYDWAREGVLVPDHHHASPKLWSYRDLVFLRLLARMRHNGMDRDQAAASVRRLRDLLTDPDFDVTTVRVGSGVFLDGSSEELTTKQQAFEVALGVLEPFDLLAPLQDVNELPRWGPDLLVPSRHTYISPDVMGGEPCVGDTRIPSASILSLVTTRHLSVPKVVQLYPQLTAELVEDAIDLEHRMRRQPAA